MYIDYIDARLICILQTRTTFRDHPSEVSLIVGLGDKIWSDNQNFQLLFWMLPGPQTHSEHPCSTHLLSWKKLGRFGTVAMHSGNCLTSWTMMVEEPLVSWPSQLDIQGIYVICGVVYYRYYYDLRLLSSKDDFWNFQKWASALFLEWGKLVFKWHPVTSSSFVLFAPVAPWSLVNDTMSCFSFAWRVRKVRAMLVDPSKPFSL